MRTLSVILLSGLAMCTVRGQPTSADILKTIDQLIEQNHQLEQQNKQLMEQIAGAPANSGRRQKPDPGGTPCPTAQPAWYGNHAGTGKTNCGAIFQPGPNSG